MFDHHEFFTSRGWKHYPRKDTSWKEKSFYAMPLPDATPCHLNGGTYLHATVYVFGKGEIPYSQVEFDVSGDAVDDQWFKLSAYAIQTKDLTDELVASIKTRLSAAWEVVNHV